jgi:hypothetical protein
VEGGEVDASWSLKAVGEVSAPETSSPGKTRSWPKTASAEGIPLTSFGLHVGPEAPMAGGLASPP